MNEVKKENKAKKGGQGSRSRSGIEGTRRGGRDAGRSLRKGEAKKNKQKPLHRPRYLETPGKSGNPRKGGMRGMATEKGGETERMGPERERERRKTEGFEAETGEEEAAMD